MSTRTLPAPAPRRAGAGDLPWDLLSLVLAGLDRPRDRAAARAACRAWRQCAARPEAWGPALAVPVHLGARDGRGWRELAAGLAMPGAAEARPEVRIGLRLGGPRARRAPSDPPAAAHFPAWVHTLHVEEVDPCGWLATPAAVDVRYGNPAAELVWQPHPRAGGSVPQSAFLLALGPLGRVRGGEVELEAEQGSCLPGRARLGTVLRVLRPRRAPCHALLAEEAAFLEAALRPGRPRRLDAVRYAYEDPGDFARDEDFRREVEHSAPAGAYLLERLAGCPLLAGAEWTWHDDSATVALPPEAP